MLTFGAGCCNIHLFAEMAELADAHGSGPCGSNTLRVRLPSSALNVSGSLGDKASYFFACIPFYCAWSEVLFLADCRQ